MFIGHFAPALVLQRVRPSLKLWQLFLAVQFVDLLWPVFVLAGLEHVRIVPGFTESNPLDLYDMPWSHSLVATFAWALFAFAVWWAWSKRPGDALVIALAVASHFFVDLIVHVPDLPLASNDGLKLGLGLWQHRAIALPLELSLFAASAYWWWRRDRTRRSGVILATLCVVGGVHYFTPDPPGSEAMVVTAFVGLLACAALAWWADRR